MRNVTKAQVAVLGAGLTGATAALELARRGLKVALIEQDALALNRASLRNEGKIHLGFVYAAEPSLATARMMLDGALTFRRRVAALLRQRTDGLSVSTPFFYLVARGSLLGPAELDAQYRRIEARCAELLAADPALDYLGLRPRTLYRSVDLGALDGRFRRDALAGAFATEERAVDTDRLAEALRAALRDEPGLRLMPLHRIRTVERSAGGFRVEGEAPGGSWQLDAEQVVNCLWEHRMAVDRQVGVESPTGWVHRLKYRVIARLPARLANGPSITMVLGRYGDVVVRGDGLGYFSWYPAAMRGWSHDVAPPEAWAPPCRGEVPAPDAQAIARDVLREIDAWYPGAAEAVPERVDAGAIVAYGRTDIDDPASGLHTRTRVGVVSVDGYHSVEPGKLTSAPLYGALAADRVCGEHAAA